MTPKFIKSATDLQTKPQAICDGFLEQAMQKTKRADPFVKEAKDFYRELKKVKSVSELLISKKCRDNLTYACGFSDKAKSQLTKAQLNDAIKKLFTRDN